ncbi:MAG: LacI family DNA-binding transcriptional regulator [Spartobacteria bacterium]
MAESHHRITLNDIARAAGVSVSCVSLALRDSPEIGASTRARLREVAARLGYRPDPALAALAAYRSRRRPAAFRSVIAYIGDAARPARSDNIRRAVLERAPQLGYRIDSFTMGSPAADWPALLRACRSRGIRGIFLGPRLRFDEPFPEVEEARDFAFITIGYSARLDGIHRVSTNQFLDMVRHVDGLRQAGFTRPGLWCPASADGRVNHQFSAGFFAAYLQSGIPAPAILAKDPVPKIALRRWIRQEAIDAVIGLPHHVEALRRAGCGPDRIPGFSCFDWDGRPEVRALRGMDYRPEFLAREAVDALHAALLQNRVGLGPDAPLTLFNAVARLG